jgi:UDP-3-O-[3-hydroxymyristoyl] glucosamine N-acyltransferase
VKLTVADLAKHLGGQLVGDGSAEIKGISPINTVKPGDVTFAENEKYFALAEKTPAVAIIVPTSITASSKTLIRIEQPKAALARVLAMFFPPFRYPPGIHPSAQVAKDAKLGADVHIGANAVVKEGASIGDRTAIDAGSVIGRSTSIGSDCVIYSNVTIYHQVRVGNRAIIHSGTVVGSDGFGYVWEGKTRLKVPQVGTVIIEDDVEIGANTAIDRATIGATIIKRGTKIDNLVQIAHNVIIGENGTVCGLVGIAGSCTIGNNVTLAGQVGMADHIKIGDNVTVGAQSGIKDDLPEANTYLGSPAVPAATAARQYVAWGRLPELLRRVHDLEHTVELLQEKLKAANRT